MHDFYFIIIIADISACFMKSVMSDYSCLSMFEGQSWRKMASLLLPVTLLRIPQFLPQVLGTTLMLSFFSADLCAGYKITNLQTK